MFTLLCIKKEKAEPVLKQALSKIHHTTLRKEHVSYLWTVGPVSIVLIFRRIQLNQGSRLEGALNIFTQLLMR